MREVHGTSFKSFSLEEDFAESGDSSTLSASRPPAALREPSFVVLAYFRAQQQACRVVVSKHRVTGAWHLFEALTTVSAGRDTGPPAEIPRENAATG